MNGLTDRRDDIAVVVVDVCSIRRTVGEERDRQIAAAHKPGERATENLRRDLVTRAGIRRVVVIA